MAAGEEAMQIQLVSKCANPAYSAVPTSVFSVPRTSTRYALSELINVLLNIQESPVPFDFMVGGEFLRTTLEGFLLAQEGRVASGESVVVVEYMEAVSRPKPEVMENQDDWVCAVAARAGVVGGADGLCVVTGSYDALMRVRMVGRDGRVDGRVPVVVGGGHAAAVKSVDVHGSLIVTGGSDRRVHLYDVLRAPKAGVLPPSVFGLHTDTVEAVAFHPLGMTVVSGGWDGMVKVWNASIDAAVEAAREAGADDDEAGAPPAKKKKTARGKKGKGKGAEVEMAPLIELEGHIGAVAAATFELHGDGTQALSGGYDHTVRVWDVPSGAAARVLTGETPVLALSLSTTAKSSAILTGHAAPEVRLWDFRSTAPAAAKFKGHHGFVPAVGWVPGSEFLFGSGSHDGNFRLWDIRSPDIPLYTVGLHTDKILALAWASAEHCYTGSADCTVGLFDLAAAAASE